MAAESRCQWDRCCTVDPPPPREQREASTCHELEAETDRLSLLPRNIIDVILSNLSLDEAVRTSVLSKGWRNVWKTIPNIVFDYKSFSVTLKQEEVPYNEQKLAEVVGEVLRNHSGMIQKFVVNHFNFTGEHAEHADIDQWIQHLSNCPVREFSLNLWGIQDIRYEVHSSFLEWKGLITLELGKCSLNHFPQSFGGLRRLKALKLCWTPMSQERFEYLVKSCPLLEILVYCHKESYFPALKIDAPRLFRFQFQGVFDELVFTHVENLAQIRIDMEWSRSNESRNMPRPRASNLMEFSRCLGNVSILHIKTQFLKYLIHGRIPQRLLGPFFNMTTLAVETDPMCQREFEAMLCMLKSFRFLDCLTILFRGREDHAESRNYLLENKNIHLDLPGMHKVVVHCFSDRFSELNLLELILLASPKLKRLWVVDFISSKGKCPVGETIRRLRLASRQAKATMLRRESCRGEDPEHVHSWINGLPVPYIPQHILESPPEPQEI